MSDIDLQPGKGPGQWQRVLVEEFDRVRRRWGALVRCAGECGRILAVVEHRIDENGNVFPSVGHPAGYPPCSWHPTPRLVGWGPVPPLPPLAPEVTCDRCGNAKTRCLGGWGTWSGSLGLICPACVVAHLGRTP